MDQYERAKESKQATDLEHARNQTTMYLGGKTPIDCEGFVIRDTNNITYEKYQESPAATQCYRETLTNAGDQCILSGDSSASIWTSFDFESGSTSPTISIKNNITCIPIIMKKTRDGREMYNPQFLFGEFKTSTNYDLEEKSVVGGKNGIGATLVNAFCKYFSVETTDLHTCKNYFQEWENCMEIVREPEIRPTDKNDKQFTTITMDFNWVDFGIKWPSQEATDFIAVCRMMTTVMAVYIPGKVHWNGKLVEICSPLPLIKAITPINICKYITTKLDGDSNMPWTVVIGVKPISIPNRGMEFISIINGIRVTGGTHIDYLKSLISEAMREPYTKCMKKLKGKSYSGRYMSNKVMQHISIVHTGQMDRPTLSGQRKDTLSEPKKNLTQYMFDRHTYNLLWSYIEPHVIHENASVKKTTRKTKVKAKKYEPAKYAGTRRKNLCWLFLPEGDSAMSTIDKIIQSKHSPITRNTHGMFSVQGVIPNVRKEIKIIRDKISNKRILVPSEKILNSERLQSLFQVLGLTWGETYSAIGQLNYAGIIIATDQDEDGKGNIRSGILNLFQTVWPELIEMGFVKFLITPVIRAFPRQAGGTVVEFMSEQKAHNWVQSIDIDKYEIIYYKGLGSHSNKEIVQMAKQYSKLIILYKTDDNLELLCEAYFGKNTNVRKSILKSPPLGDEEKYYMPDRSIFASNHLNTDTKAYQQYNIRRHIPHFMDGLTPGPRKVIAGAMKKWKQNNTRCKVFQLGGYVTQHMNYHHGDASINGSIIKLVQNYVGAKNFPPLRALSNFGTRKKGGKDAGSPRYIYTCLNKRLTSVLFPADDWWVLDYTFDDGERGEPTHLSPIIPLAIAESYKSPGTGWATTVWGRDYFALSERIRAYIKDDDFKDDDDLPLSDWNMRHMIVQGKNNLTSIGSYERTGENTITVTEMPIRTWNITLTDGSDKKSAIKKKSKYEIEMFRSLNENPHIIDKNDNSSDKKIEINITFKAGVIDTIMSEYDGGQYDPMIRYLGLTQSLASNINFVNNDNTVNEYKKYIDVFDEWYTMRKETYGKRVDRQLILLKLNIICLKNQIKYATNRHSYKINNISMDEQIKILLTHKYQKMDKSLLDRPAYTDVKTMEEEILRGPKVSYKYLLKMSALDTNKKSLESLILKLTSAQQKLDAISSVDESFKGASQWLNELDQLDKIVTTVRATGWDSWDKKVKW